MTTKKTGKKSSKKRIVVISDLHCGHETGLTPPNWQYKPNDKSEIDFIKRRTKYSYVQNETWNFYTKTIDSLRDIDILFVLGDCIDGAAPKSGGSELITTDLNQQIEIAAECINYVKAKEIVMVYGTPYHAGTITDCEDVIADKVKASKISGREWVDVNGVIFDLKHKTGGSQTPQSRQTSISKQKMWNDIWSDKQLQPKANVILRGHNHYDGFIGNSDWLGINVPGFQWSTKFGVRQCDGIVSIGLVYFDVNVDGTYDWGFKMADLQHQKAKAIKL